MKVLGSALLFLTMGCQTTMNSPLVATASPRLSLWSRKPLLVTVTIGSLAGRLGCGSVSLAWGDGSVSTRDSDYDPEEVCPERIIASHYYNAPGDYVVVISVESEGKRYRIVRDVLIKDTSESGW
jgi:hypothetical protein